VAVGDKPTLEFRAIDGQQVNLKDYRGKLVIVDFWSVSDASQNLERRLVGIYKQHADDGLAVIGICCDRELPRSQVFIRENGLTWPNYWDGQMWQCRIAQEWGHAHIGSILIGPDGTVLWVGTPMLLDKQVNAALIQHPPTIVDPDTLAKAQAAMEAAEKALKEDDRIGAVAAIASIPDECRKNKSFAQKLASVEPKAQEAGKQLLADVDALVQQKRFIEAADQLRAMDHAFGPAAIGDLVRERLRNLQSDPAARAAFDQVQKEKDAADALAAARKLRDQQQNEQAYLRLKSLVQDYPSTQAAADAQPMLADYEHDTALMQRIKEQSVETKAKSILSVARSYATAKKFDLAREKYQEVIAQFPNTRYADTARQEMTALEKP
jgi:peroxiredoxin